MSKEELTTWTVSVNGKIKPIGILQTFDTKKACQAYIDDVYFGGFQDFLKVKPVKIKIEII